MNSPFVTGTLKHIVTVFLMVGIWLCSSSIKAETVSAPKSTAQQLEGIEAILARNGAERSDGVGEQATNSDSEFTIPRPSEQTTKTIGAGYSGSVIELSDYSRADWELHSASQDWLNLNRGDGSQDLVRIVVFRF